MARGGMIFSLIRDLRRNKSVGIIKGEIDTRQGYLASVIGKSMRYAADAWAIEVGNLWGQRILDTAQQLVPVDSGDLSDSLTMSVTSGAEKTGTSIDAGESGVSVSASIRAYSGQVTVTVSANHPKAIFIEFGTSNMAAQPFLRPALEQNSSPDPAEMSRIWSELEDEMIKTQANQFIAGKIIEYSTYAGILAGRRNLLGLGKWYISRLSGI